MKRAALYNGQDAGPIAGSRGLHYGDGVFRTLLIHDGEIRDWTRQLGKLLADAQALRLQPPEPALLHAESQRLAEDHAHAVLKIILTRRDEGARGYRSASDDCDRLLQISAAPRYPEYCWGLGIAAFRSAVQLAEQPMLAGIKHLNRLEQVLASRDWPAQAGEGILGNAQGHVICGTRSNLFWCDGEVLYTPDLRGCGVAGMMRERVLDLAREIGIQARVAHATWQQLSQVQEAFVTNSLIGIWPLRSLDAHSWPAPGPITRRLQAALNHPRLC